MSRRAKCKSPLSLELSVPQSGLYVNLLLRFNSPLSPLEWMRLTRVMAMISLAQLVSLLLITHIPPPSHLHVVPLPHYTHRTVCNPSTTLWGCGGESSHLPSTTATQPIAFIPASIHCLSLTALPLIAPNPKQNTSCVLLQTNCSHACTCCCWCRSPTFSSIKRKFLHQLFLCHDTVTGVIPPGLDPHVVYSPDLSPVVSTVVVRMYRHIQVHLQYTVLTNIYTTSRF
jgi:hypothetical protein